MMGKDLNPESFPEVRIVLKRLSKKVQERYNCFPIDHDLKLMKQLRERKHQELAPYRKASFIGDASRQVYFSTCKTKVSKFSNQRTYGKLSYNVYPSMAQLKETNTLLNQKASFIGDATGQVYFSTCETEVSKVSDQRTYGNMSYNVYPSMAQLEETDTLSNGTFQREPEMSVSFAIENSSYEEAIMDNQNKCLSVSSSQSDSEQNETLKNVSDYKDLREADNENNELCSSTSIVESKNELELSKNNPVIENKDLKEADYANNVLCLSSATEYKNELNKSWKNTSSLKTKNLQKFRMKRPVLCDPQFCIECGKSITEDHFAKEFVCMDCTSPVYSTYCYNAFMEHRGSPLFNQKDNAIYGLHKPNPLRDFYYCSCGYSSVFGNKLAFHMMGCKDSTCYYQEMSS